MKYTHLLPFLDKEELKKVAYEVINGEITTIKLEMLYPFLGRETLNEIVTLLIEKKDAPRLGRLLPFISKEKVQEIYQMAENGDIPGFDTSRCIPFLGSEQVKEIFRELIKKEVNTTPSTDEVNEDDDDDEDDEEDDDDEN